MVRLAYRLNPNHKHDDLKRYEIVSIEWKKDGQMWKQTEKEKKNFC